MPNRSLGQNRMEEPPGAAPAHEAPRFLLADDHRFVSDALAFMIKQHWPRAEVAQTDRFAGAMALLGKMKVDVAVLDFRMPGLSGLAAIEQIRHRHPDPKLVILSGTIEPREALQALSLGAVAYVPKSIAAESIIQVLTLVLGGETYVPRGLIDAIVKEPACAPAMAAADGARLSGRDAQLLDALIKGHPNKVIAHAMGVSESTVKLYMNKLFKTLGVHNRTEAVARGIHYMRSAS